MQGIERAYCDICIKALIAAWRALMEAPVSELLSKVKYGKGDTLGFDAIPEIIISERLKSFDNHAILITEELDKITARRWPGDPDPLLQPLMFFSDPTDRSKQLKIFLEALGKNKPLAKVGDLMRGKNINGRWEKMFEPPAVITGATGSITCVRKGSIIFSVILNYVSHTIFIASPINIMQIELPSYQDNKLDNIDLSYIFEHGSILTFPPSSATCRKSDDFKRFVTFLGKSGYQENFVDSMIFMESPDDFLHHTEPGGPARILYLSGLQHNFGPIGFILANGEKIGEWIHWLSFAKFAKNKQGHPALKVFEISLDRPWTKEGILMSTSVPYSIFRSEGAQAYLDISRLKNFESPSRFRSMLVITPSDNERIIYLIRKHEYREISFAF